MITILILYLASGVLLALLSLPLLFDKIPPNPFYGFRVSKTLSDPKVWYAANRYSARWLFATGLSVLLVSIIFYFIPGITVDIYAISCLIIFALVLTASLIKSFLYIRGL